MDVPAVATSARMDWVKFAARRDAGERSQEELEMVYAAEVAAVPLPEGPAMGAPQGSGLIQMGSPRQETFI